MSTCQTTKQPVCEHPHVETVEYETCCTSEEGPVFEITSYTFCLDCGEEIEVPCLEFLEVDREPTVYEIEIGAKTEIETLFTFA